MKFPSSSVRSATRRARSRLRRRPRVEVLEPRALLTTYSFQPIASWSGGSFAPQVNNNGDVAYYQVSNGQATLYKYKGDGSGFTPIGPQSSASPYNPPSRPSINNAGQVGWYEPAAFGSGRPGYVRVGDGSSTTTIATVGAGWPIDYVPSPRVAVNEAGSAAFAGHLQTSPPTVNSLLTGSGGPLATVATGSAGIFYYVEPGVDVNSSGAVSFVGWDGDGGPGRGLYVADDDGVTLIAHAGDRYGRDGFKVFGSAGWTSINDAGTVAFTATPRSGGYGGIYTWNDGTTQLAVAAQSYDASSDIYIQSFGAYGMKDDGPVVNEAGVVAFTALGGIDTTTDHAQYGTGIFLWNPQTQSVEKVVIAGDNINGRRVESVYSGVGLSDDGRVSFIAKMVGGGDYIVRADPHATSTFTVTSTDDNGNNFNPSPGSLRAAIVAADNNPDPSTIDFNIPGAGPFTIDVSTSLPTIVTPVTIDGYTQPGTSPNTLAKGTDAVVLIGLRGAGASSGNGITIAADNTTVRGLALNQFAYGIWISAGTGIAIEGNFIGVDFDGMHSSSNHTGIITDPDGPIGTVRIGTNADGSDDLAERNLISGNGDGVFLYSTDGAVVAGNLIGVDRTGAGAIGNSVYGVHVYISKDNRIGGLAPVSGNVIAFNGSVGVYIDGASSTGNSILGNRIWGNGSGISLTYDGANNNQVPPLLAAPVLAGAGSSIRGTFSGTPSTTYRVELFVNDFDPNPNKVPQGQRLLGSFDVTTDSSGQGAFSFSDPAVVLTVGQTVTATLTSPTGDTSMFTNPFSPFPPRVVEPPLKVAEVVVNDGSAQRSNIATVSIRFNRDANIADLIASGEVIQAVQLFRTSSPSGQIALGTERFSYDGSTATLVIDLTADGPGPSLATMLGDGRYRLSLSGALITAAGEPDNPLLDNGGSSAAPYLFDFHRLQGDYNGDGVVNTLDRTLFSAHIGGRRVGPPAAVLNYNLIYDFNGDGIVNLKDYAAFRALMGHTV